MEISLAAIMSIVALLIVVIISCVNEDLNVGFLGIAFAIIVGGIWGETTAAKVMGYFPTGLFMILVGVTFLFGMAQTNGTMEKLTAYSVRLCKGNTAFMPLIIFVLTTFVTTIGPGNIAGTALMAPVAMAIATRIGMPAFLMTLIVVGAANGAAFSPFAPTGIISNGIIAKMAGGLGITDLSGLAWKIHFNSEIAQGLVNIGGFFILGGWAWIKKQRGETLNIDELAPKPEPFNKHQILTLSMVGILILLVVLPGLPATKALFSKTVLNLLSNVGSIAFMLAGVLMLTGSGDSKAAIKVMPWGVMLMVCGVTVLIEVMDKAGGLNALVKVIGAISTPTTVNAWLGLITGAISAYSSSSGVVMPMFLPMVPGLIKEVGGGNPIAMISSINIGAHLVDTSPLSTLGALCIACAGEHEDKAKLFRNLLIWGLSMSVVGAIVCYVFFGLLNL
ncbi:di/tricarboxylate transporter [Anaerospora hongkongensis]|uniref:Di/tricarboxylate transporter n=1 Tax=Anaerospora hongkongensis TaxID=244830 RepID=A0A4R1PYL6_9FIRM|nr:SLC13 family permease [Anaerospora hongkongensis]TCL36500.1 di/tricarboxylate transporter [Anaerospora hongkongensis]